MDFEWDENKNRANVQKHHLSFENACRVFADPLHRSVLQDTLDGEERWETIGSIGGVLVVVVISTVRYQVGAEIIRIISARRATKREKRNYEEN